MSVAVAGRSVVPLNARHHLVRHELEPAPAVGAGKDMLVADDDIPALDERRAVSFVEITDGQRRVLISDPHDEPRARRYDRPRRESPASVLRRCFARLDPEPQERTADILRRQRRVVKRDIREGIVHLHAAFLFKRHAVRQYLSHRHRSDKGADRGGPFSFAAYVGGYHRAEPVHLGQLRKSSADLQRRSRSKPAAMNGRIRFLVAQIEAGGLSEIEIDTNAVCGLFARIRNAQARRRTVRRCGYGRSRLDIAHRKRALSVDPHGSRRRIPFGRGNAQIIVVKIWCERRVPFKAAPRSRVAGCDNDIVLGYYLDPAYSLFVFGADRNIKLQRFGIVKVRTEPFAVHTVLYDERRIGRRVCAARAESIHDIFARKCGSEHKARLRRRSRPFG